MSIVVMSDVGGNGITIIKRKEQRMSMDLSEAQQLYSYLKFTLGELISDEVIKARSNLISGVYDGI